MHIFDVDHTLVRRSTGRHLAMEGLRSGTLSIWSVLALPVFYLRYRMGNLDLHKIDHPAAVAAGFTKEQWSALAENAFTRHTRDDIYPQAASYIRHLQERDLVLALASTSFDFTLAPVARFLDIPIVISTVLEFADGVSTGGFEGKPCYAREKLTRTLQRADELGVRPEDIAFYTDSYHDLPLLGAVGFPVAVHPDRRLKRVAEFETWPIIDWNR